MIELSMRNIPTKEVKVSQEEKEPVKKVDVKTTKKSTKKGKK